MKKPSIEEVESLTRVILSDDWKVILKYIAILQENQQDDLFSCENKPDVVYYSWAKNVGSKELLKGILDLKDFVRSLQDQKKKAVCLTQYRVVIIDAKS